MDAPRHTALIDALLALARVQGGAGARAIAAAARSTLAVAQFIGAPRQQIALMSRLHASSARADARVLNALLTRASLVQQLLLVPGDVLINLFSQTLSRSGGRARMCSMASSRARSLRMKDSRGGWVGGGGVCVCGFSCVRASTAMCARCCHLSVRGSNARRATTLICAGLCELWGVWCLR
jgi:hypothetical protein